MAVFNQGNIGAYGEWENMNCGECDDGNVKFIIYEHDHLPLSHAKTEQYRCGNCGGTGWVKNPMYKPYYCE